MKGLFKVKAISGFVSPFYGPIYNALQMWIEFLL